MFDSPPALAASPAAVLAGLVGQVMLVVRADRTPESEVAAAVVLGAPLSSGWLPVLAAGGAGAALALGLLLGALLLLAHLQARRVQDGPAVLRLLPYGTVVVAALAPLAVGAYLLTSTAWTVAERAALDRLL